MTFSARFKVVPRFETNRFVSALQPNKPNMSHHSRVAPLPFRVFLCTIVLASHWRHPHPGINPLFMFFLRAYRFSHLLAFKVEAGIFISLLDSVFCM